MRKWLFRSEEIAYLFNPAFCGRILLATIKEYNDKNNSCFPFPLLYLILPLILHRSARETINSRKKFVGWIQENTQIMIDFPGRAKNMVQITNEAVEFLLQTRLVKLNSEGEIEIPYGTKKLGFLESDDDEIKDCLKKSEHLARWFVSARNVATIYVLLGVKP